MEYVKSLYEQYVQKVKDITEEHKDELKSIAAIFAKEAKQYVINVANEVMTLAIAEARKELKKLADQAIEKIEKESLKVKTKELYATLDLKIAGIVDSEKYKELIENLINEFSEKLIELYEQEALLTVEQYKEFAIEKLDKIYNEYLGKIEDDTVKALLKDYYDLTKTKINECKTIDEVKAIYGNIEKDVKEYVKTTLVEKIITGYKGKLEDIVNTQLEKITDQELKKAVQDMFTNLMKKFDGVTDLEQLKLVYEDIKATLPEEIEKLIKEYGLKMLNEAKKLAIEYINDQLDIALAKLSNDELKKELTSAKDAALAEIEKIEDVNTFEAAIEKVKSNFVTSIANVFLKVIKVYTDEAKSASNEIYTIVTAKLPANKQAELKVIYDKYVDSLLAIDNIDTAKADVKKATDKFLSDIQSYVTEALVALKAEALAAIEPTYTSLLNNITNDDYRTQLMGYFNDAVTAINALNDIKTFVADVKVITNNFMDQLKQFGTLVLASAKTAAIEYINTTISGVLNKVEDNKYVTQLNTTKDNAITEINKITDVDSYNTAIENIKTQFVNDMKAILVQIIKQYVDLAQTEANEIKTIILAKLSDKSKTAFNTIYNNYVLALKAIDNFDTAKQSIEDATTQFVNDTKTYVAEALLGLKTEAIALIQSKYNEVYDTIDLAEWKTNFQTLFNEATEAINALNEIKTFAESASAIVSKFNKDAIAYYAEYLSAKTEIIKTETLEKGAKAYEEVYKKEEYTSKGYAAKLVAKASIEAAYKAFKTAVDELTPSVGAQTVCDGAYNTLISAFNKALGITE